MGQIEVLQERIVGELAEHMDAMDRLASVYVRQLVADAVEGSSRLRPAPRGLHPMIAKLCRELADDQVVMAIRAGELARVGRRLAMAGKDRP